MYALGEAEHGLFVGAFPRVPRLPYQDAPSWLQGGRLSQEGFMTHFRGEGQSDLSASLVF